MVTSTPGDSETRLGTMSRTLYSPRLSDDVVRSLYREGKRRRMPMTQLADHLTTRGMPTEVASIRREHVEDYVEHQIDTRSASTIPRPCTQLAVTAPAQSLDSTFEWRNQ